MQKILPDDKRIMQLFKDHDLDKDDLLTQDDFLRFYRLQSQNSPDIVWNNLQAFGYTSSLTREARGETTYTNDPQLTTD